jgi:hypothetical protein
VSTTIAVTTGLLSDKQRAYLEGDREGELENPDQYERKLRHQANQRVQQMADDIELLEAHGHEDIVAKFYYQISRIERLRRDLRGRDGGDNG